MHDNVLVLGDGTKHFMRSVRLAALYSEKVHVWAPIQDSTIALFSLGLSFAYPSPADIEAELDFYLIDEDQQLLKTQPASRSLLVQKYQDALCEHPGKRFLTQCISNRDDLDTLRQEGVLVSALEEFASNLPTLQTEGMVFLGEMKNAVAGLGTTIMQPGDIPSSLLQMEEQGYGHISSLFTGILEGLLAFGEMNGMNAPPEIEKMFDENDGAVVGVGFYFLLASYYASRNGCAGVSADKDSQKVFDSTISALSESLGDNPLLAKRNRIKALLGEEVLRAEVPDVSSMPIDAILALRERRGPELQAFRASLASLATNIDLGLEERDLGIAVRDQIDQNVRPRVSELRVALNDASRRATVDAIKGSNILGLATLGLSAASGIPLETGAQLTAGTVALEKMFNWLVGSRGNKADALKSSPWSILLYLKNEA